MLNQRKIQLLLNWVNMKINFPSNESMTKSVNLWLRQRLNQLTLIEPTRSSINLWLSQCGNNFWSHSVIASIFKGFQSTKCCTFFESCPLILAKKIGIISCLCIFKVVELLTGYYLKTRLSSSKMLEDVRNNTQREILAAHPESIE